MDGLVCSSVVTDLHDIFTDPVWFKVNAKKTNKKPKQEKIKDTIHKLISIINLKMWQNHTMGVTPVVQSTRLLFLESFYGFFFVLHLL